MLEKLLQAATVTGLLMLLVSSQSPIPNREHTETLMQAGSASQKNWY